jgi:two-component system, chemotaxis family, protein-glutamate methylesterase/glutaminase
MTIVPEDSRADPVEAVVIGASAGGLDALKALFEALPPDFLPPVFAVLHLPAHGAPGLIPLLDDACALPVTAAVDKQQVQPGTVVLAPPNYHLLVEPDRRLALSVDAPENYARPALDPLFESAAAVYGRGLLCLVLTGANRDGSAGAVAVRRRGGRLWVQDPATAYSPEMPAAALAAAGADAVLSLPDMARRLAAAGAR